MLQNRNVTIGIIAYNEQRYLPDLLEDIVQQTYTKKNTEIVLVDGGSTDCTVSLMQQFKEKYDALYKRVLICQNPRRIQPAGWNVVIQNMSTDSDVLLRIDAHARLPEDFVQKNINCLESGECVCGGPRENIIDENTAWKRMLLSAERSMFGSGFAKYRRKNVEKEYVNSVFHGAYRKEVLDKVGLFNEQLVRTEDNEYHYRVRSAGYKICYDSGIESFYQTRSSLKGMLKQKYLNGFWIGKTLKICPGCISLFHLVPLAFVVAVIVAVVMGVFFSWLPLLAIGVAYGGFLIASTGVSIFESHNVLDLFLPFVILAIHFAYGTGTLLGILSPCERESQSL